MNASRVLRPSATALTCGTNCCNSGVVVVLLGEQRCVPKSNELPNWQPALRCAGGCHPSDVRTPHRVGVSGRPLKPPSEPCVRVSPHTAQAFLRSASAEVIRQSGLSLLLLASE